MSYRERVELEAKDTIGYSEAENKKSFMTGVSVAISKLEEKYESRIKVLEQKVKYAVQNGDVYKQDLKTLAAIMNKYSDND